jgi:hypothetical protein
VCAFNLYRGRGRRFRAKPAPPTNITEILEATLKKDQGRRTPEKADRYHKKQNKNNSLKTKPLDSLSERQPKPLFLTESKINQNNLRTTF